MTAPQKRRETDPDTAGRRARADPPLNYLNLRVNQLLCCLSLSLGVFCINRKWTQGPLYEVIFGRPYQVVYCFSLERVKGNF